MTGDMRWDMRCDMTRQGWRRIAVLVALACASVAAMPARADETWSGVLARSPRWLAAQQAHQAALARAHAVEVNPNDWTPQASWAQRSVRTEPGQLATSDTREWSIGVSRGVRSPGKVAAAEDWARRQREWADAERAQAWLTLCREALDEAGALSLARQQASLWRAHADNLTAQHQALRRRHELGDAARQDVILADAARAQAASQATLAEQRATALQVRWGGRYPGLAVPSVDGVDVVGDADEAMEALLSRHPTWQAAEARALALKAQARHAQADRQPDPVLGVQYGRERSGAERVVGFNVTWPLGGPARSALADAQVAEAESAQAELQDLRRTLRADLLRWQAEARQSGLAAQGSALALAQTEQAEQALRRGQALGQVSVGEVLQLQRQLIEQGQLAAQARVDAWSASLRWSLESGRVWGVPADAPPAGSD